MAEEKKIPVRIHLAVDSLDEADVARVETMMKEVCPSLSFSPARPAPGLDHCLEVMGSGMMGPEEKANAIALWNNDWDRDEEDSWFRSYGFNTKMFDALVYYLELDFA